VFLYNRPWCIGHEALATTGSSPQFLILQDLT
jgi:hypothetical protein